MFSRNESPTWAATAVGSRYVLRLTRCPPRVSRSAPGDGVTTMSGRRSATSPAEGHVSGWFTMMPVRFSNARSSSAKPTGSSPGDRIVTLVPASGRSTRHRVLAGALAGSAAGPVLPGDASPLVAEGHGSSAYWAHSRALKPRVRLLRTRSTTSASGKRNVPVKPSRSVVHLEGSVRDGIGDVRALNGPLQGQLGLGRCGLVRRPALVARDCRASSIASCGSCLLASAEAAARRRASA